MAATIDQQFVEYIAKTIVSNPDVVQVQRSIDERGVLLELYVDPDDLGRVIGRGGSTAKSMRTLLRALGVKNDARYNLKIIDTSEEGMPDEDTSTEESEEAEDEEADTEETPEEENEEADDDEDEDEEEEPDAVAQAREDLKDLTDLDI